MAASILPRPSSYSSVTSSPFIMERDMYISSKTRELIESCLATINTLDNLLCLRDKVLGHPGLRRFLVLKEKLVQRLIPLINTNDPRLSREAIVILGSMAFGAHDEVRELLRNSVPQLLLKTLTQTNDVPLIEAILRTLKNIYRHQGTQRDLPFQPEYLSILISVFSKTENIEATQICEYCAVLLANCCDSREKQVLIKDLVRPVMKLCKSKNISDGKIEAGLDLMAALTRDNEENCRLAVEAEAIPLLLEIVAQKRARPEIRIYAGICLANLYHFGYMHKQHAEDKIVSNQISNVLLPSLIALMAEDSGVRGRAAQVLALLIRDAEDLQAAICKQMPQVITRLCELLTGPKSHVEEEAALLAFAALASNREECRQSVIDAKILPIVVQSMSSDNADVRSAACQCTRALSRSVKNLRTSLLDAGMARPILTLLKDENSLVRKNACATLCNLVLDFSPMKEIVLKEGGVSLLVTFLTPSQGNDNELRYNALWAIKNLLYMAGTDVKRATMEQLTFSRLEKLAKDENCMIREQALNIIRNLVSDKDSDIVEVIQSFGLSQIISLVEFSLTHDKLPQGESLLTHALFIVANICTALSPIPKEAVMNNSIVMQFVLKLLELDVPEQLQMAALWCIINLTWTDDTGSTARVAHLRATGTESNLRSLLSNGKVSPDVKERAQTALDNFCALDPPPSAIRP